jgi:hypothetical protein
LAARVTGVAWVDGRAVPKTLVFISPEGVICGVAHSSGTAPLANRIFYFHKFARNMGFLGYIRGYDPTLQYTIRSADGGTLSDEKIVVPPATSIPSS